MFGVFVLDALKVTHLFTDKTGTLTENRMIFRNCSINGHKYYATRTIEDPSHILVRDNNTSEQKRGEEK